MARDASPGRFDLVDSDCIRHCRHTDPVEIFLKTERMVMRRLTTADVDNLATLDSDPEVMRYLSGSRPTPRATIENEVLPRLLSYYDRYDSYGYWAAVDKESGEFLGWFCLRPKDTDDVLEPELGYRLRKAAWGKGLATEGSRALISKAFNELGARRVYAETMTVHAASRRVMEKAGLRYLRTYFKEWSEPIEGQEDGVVEYERHREATDADLP